MNDNPTKRHDRRQNNWQVSLSDEEYAEVERRWKSTGLSKAAFTRDALIHGHIQTRINPEEMDIARGLLGLTSEIKEMRDYLIEIIRTDVIFNAPDSFDIAAEKLTEMEELCCKIANTFSSKFDTNDRKDYIHKW